jgi:hypothetical protein
MPDAANTGPLPLSSQVAAAHAAALDRQTISGLRSSLLEQEQQLQVLRSQGVTRVRPGGTCCC